LPEQTRSHFQADPEALVARIDNKIDSIAPLQ
jgi:hypothetical protein